MAYAIFVTVSAASWVALTAAALRIERRRRNRKAIQRRLRRNEEGA